jgi:hypothetical protein
MRISKRFTDERGQALVLIVLVIAIGATVAFAVAGRTIQDIRRVGKERVSEEAGETVQTVLDVATSSSAWDDIVDANGAFLTSGVCNASIPGRSTVSADKTLCCLSTEYIGSLVGGDAGGTGWGCDQVDLCIRQELGIETKDLAQDEVLEINLAGATTTAFQVKWTGSAPHLLIKTIGIDADGNIAVLEETALEQSTLPAAWGTPVLPDTFTSVTIPANAQFARIRATGGSATISAIDVPAQESLVKVSCYKNDVFREFIRRVPLFSSVPESFDYALYDGSTQLDER